MPVLLTLVLMAVSLAVPSLVMAAEQIDIEACAYADNAAAAAVWTPQDGSDAVTLAGERTPDGKPALAFRCDMPRLQARAYWDRKLALDLARYGRVSFWAKAEGDRSAISGCSLYFNAGDGWYGATFGLPGGEWRRVTLDRSAFRVEDNPEGWHAIQGMRLAFWKGHARQVTVFFGGLQADSQDILIVRSRQGKDAQQYAERVGKMLQRIGVDYGTVDSADVENGVLTGKRLVFYPYNPRVSDKESDALDAFTRAGGRVIACYSLTPRMAALLGLDAKGFLAREYAGQFAQMRFVPGGLPGLPPEARQGSWNIERVRPVARGARVLAQWHDEAGKDTGYPAVVLSDTGAYISHVILDDDRDNKDNLLRALLGHLCPGTWETLAKKALAGAGQVSRWSTFPAATAGIEAAAAKSRRSALVAADLTAARRAYAGAEALLKAGRHTEVLAPAAQARMHLLDAYSRCVAPREGEFRAVWIHSAYGVSGLSWDEAIRRLKENGFTAVVPNMLWGGVADYASEVLPVRDRVAREGDQIARCVAAGKKYGVQVHVWKVNYNLSGAPKEFVERMRAEGRLQRTAKGEEEPWLCPSHPANVQLEQDAMLEVARKYDVDGIHFDYIRYPGRQNCYCDPCRARFEERAGVKVAEWPKDVVNGGAHYEAYQDFRRANITRLVEAVRREARKVKPDLKVSAAVFRNWPNCRDDVGQDWVSWIEKGYLDFVCPMNYTDSDDTFRTWIQVQREAVKGRIPLYAGVGASSPGLPVDQVIDQIQIAREEGCEGFIIFEYARDVAATYVPTLGRGTTAPKAVGTR